MRSLESALRGYLKQAGRLEVVHLGQKEDSEPAAPAADPQSEALAAYLGKQMQFQNSILVMLIAMICIIFIGALGVLRTLSSVTSIGMSVALLLGVVAALHRIWFEKILTDLILYALHNMPSGDAIRVIEVVYWNLSHRAGK